MSAPLLLLLLTSCLALGKLLHHLFLRPAFVCAGDGYRAFCSQMRASSLHALTQNGTTKVVWCQG